MTRLCLFAAVCGFGRGEIHSRVAYQRQTDNFCKFTVCRARGAGEARNVCVFRTSRNVTETFHSPRQTERETSTSISPPLSLPLLLPSPLPFLSFPLSSLLSFFRSNVCLRGSTLVCFYRKSQTGWLSKLTSHCSGNWEV